MKLREKLLPTLPGLAIGLLLALVPSPSAVGQTSDDAGAALVAAMLGETPLLEDLRYLTDEIGGRPTGSAANERAVEWAMERFGSAGVSAATEAYEMPAFWLELSAAAQVRTPDGDVSFEPRIAAMPFSPGTVGPDGTGLTAPLVDSGRGTEEDFHGLGQQAAGAWALVETDPLLDLTRLLADYANNAAIEKRALAAGVAGVAYVAAREGDLLYRHNASTGPETDRPMIVIERDAGLRALRLLRFGHELQLVAHLEIDSGPAYVAHNVIGEIRGSERPEEFVVMGAHIDSWALGTGALDNGCNVVMLIDIARQMKRLGMTPKRTIRFALHNGEEQIFRGSHAYTLAHADELDRHVMASSFDAGSGRITGFFTGGRAELVRAADRALAAVSDLGPFNHLDIPIVGTDNYDFMMQGVGNLVAIQESANYGPNYHAGSDTFDKVDKDQLKKNSAIVAAVAWGFANMDVDWERQSRAQVEDLVARTDLEQQMRSFGVWQAWQDGSRGRSRPAVE